MQIILQEDVDKLGQRGEIVNVAEGYARNYLLPRKLGIPADKSNLHRLEKIRGKLAARTASEREAAQKLAESLTGVSVTLRRKAGENDQLFGSVNSADIADGLAAQGFTVDKRRIALDQPIKLVGEFDVPARLHHDVTVNIKVIVQREG